MTRSARGRRLARLLAARLLEIAGELGVERAMLFCRPELTSLYGQLGFVTIESRVWVDHPRDKSRCRYRRCGARSATTSAGLPAESICWGSRSEPAILAHTSNRCSTYSRLEREALSVWSRA